jgi:hypothetical protein
MSAGITRVHGTAAVPSQRPSTLSFFTITFASNILTAANTTSDVGVVDGALDRIFRTAIPTVAVVAMIGTVATNGLTLRFAIEDTGADLLSPSYLGMGPSDTIPASTAAAIQAAIVALGTVNGIALASATVAAFAL